MKKRIFFGILVAIALIVLSVFLYYRFVIYQPPRISEKDRAAITLMPLPAKLELGKGKLELSEGLIIKYTGTSYEIVNKSVERMLSKLEKRSGRSLTSESGIEFFILCENGLPSDYPQHGIDESYDLVISRNEIKLNSTNPVGIIRGLETVYQLVQEENGNLSLPYCIIEDRPRFTWRGIMIDVSRHWISKEVILRTLDAMATVKMNVFHWHLSDDQGFRVESKVFPRLHEVGSKGKYYSQKDIREVINYAAERGIRVIPEFDLPGHSKSWQIAYPELSSVEYPLRFGIQNGAVFSPPVDPSKEEVYDFLDKFIEEMAGLFPDQYFHIGGDEVNPKFWNENSRIRNFMEEKNLEDAHDLQGYFISRMNGILRKHGKKMIGWNEVFDPKIAPEVVIQAWTSHKALFEAVQQDGTGILSAGLYLDHILPAEEHYRVDPVILPGAIDIEPDTNSWEMFDLTMEIGNQELESQLVVFNRDTNNIYGFFAVMDDRTSFKNGTIRDNILTFSFEGPAGEMDYEALISGDSLSGTISLGLMSFNSSGYKIGGNDMPGTELPEFEVIKPLTETEKSRILGGEACQWAEFVDDKNIESRIWPRSAAIAEKLWSPQELTSDVDDMYRRLAVLSRQLTEQGSRHVTIYNTKLKEMISPDGLPYLKNLTDFLQEVKFHGRMPSLFEKENLYLPDYPLDRIVDAARPESMEARSFNKMVDTFIKNTENTGLRSEIIEQLETWRTNHGKLLPYFDEHEKLKDIENISGELAKASGILIDQLNCREIEKKQLQEMLEFLETGENGLVLAVVPGLRRLSDYNCIY